MSRKIILYEESDAELSDVADDTWVGVKNFSINIIKTDEGVVIDVHARGCEDCNALVSTYAFDSEAEEMIDNVLREDEEE